MDDMPSSRHQRCQTIGIRLGPLRRSRGLGQMDIQVDGARMVRVLSQDAFGSPYGVASLALGGLAICLPVIPGREVHEGVDREDSDLRIIRKAPRGVRHRLGIGAVEGGSLYLWVICITFGQGL